MSTFRQLQHKNTVASSSVVPTYPVLRPSRSLVSRPTPTSEQAHPVTQAQLGHAARFGHSFARIALFPPEQKNSTGLPDPLKAGVENLSGMSMDDVNVHYNSSQPASVQALAYTQGTEIHVGPGQEKHLPHEAWHVVQQKQGRVEAMAQAMGVTINDDERLEREVSVMGERANQIGTGNVQRKEISDISFLEEEVRHPPEPVQPYRVDADTPSIMQFAKQTPTYTPGPHATILSTSTNCGM